MSINGFVAGPSQSERDPRGVGGIDLHAWLVELAVFRDTHGQGGGEVNASTSIAEGSFENVGASIMGRNMFGGSGPWGDKPWKGLWGDEPPFHHPVFVLTRYAREPLQLEGDNTFQCVTDGIKAALEQAKTTAGGKDVSLGGGADVVGQ
jgi:dihydrofolate reductase